MSATFILASAASGALGKKVMKSSYSASAWVSAAEPPSLNHVSPTDSLARMRYSNSVQVFEEGLQVEPGHVVAAFLHGHHGLVVEFLVGLLRLHASQRVGVQVVGLLLLLACTSGDGHRPGSERSSDSRRRSGPGPGPGLR